MLAQNNLNRCFLKAFGLALIFMAVVAIPKAFGGIFALVYWVSFSGTFFSSGPNAPEAFETMAKGIAANHGIEGIKGILAFLVFGWVSIQVLKEKDWVLRVTRITKAEPASDSNAEKAPGGERES